MCYKLNISGSVQTDCTVSAQKICGYSIDLEALGHVWLSMHAQFFWITWMSRANLEPRTLQTYYTRDSHRQNNTIGNPQDLQAGCACTGWLISACAVETVQVSRFISAQSRISHWAGLPTSWKPWASVKTLRLCLGACLQRKWGVLMGTQVCGGSVVAPWQQQGLPPVHFASDIQMLSSSDSLCLMSVSRGCACLY